MSIYHLNRLNFREAIEDLFGFADKYEKVPTPKPEDELPIQPFYMTKMFESLSHEKMGGLIVSRPFEDHVQWGNSAGALRARLTPNLGVCLERLTTDLTGRSLWITKKLVRVKTHEFINHEDIVAKELGEHLKFIAREPIDSAQRDYKKLFELTKRISHEIRGANKYFVFDEIKKVAENNYNIQMSLMGAGVGKIAATGAKRSKQTALGIIDLSYNPERGTIKSIINTVDIESEGSPWTIDIPYFVGNFLPSQPIEEVVRIVIAGLKFI